MIQLISSIEQLEERIMTYAREAAAMTRPMPNNRAWYAIWTEQGWLLGPSKFVGYDFPDVDAYLEREKSNFDGRVTEGVLQKWVELIEEGHPKYEELHTALNVFCARFGKKPNSLARISIVKTKVEASVPMYPDDLVALMVAVYRKLTPAQRSAFQHQTAQP